MVAPSGDPLLEDDPADEFEPPAEPWRANVETRETIVAAALHGQRLDRAVVALAPEFSRSHLQLLIEQGYVRVDAEAATTAARKVRAGQRLEVMLVPTAESRAFRPEPIALDVVHEDDDVLVLNKAAGLVVHPAAGNWTGTLLNGLLERYPRGRDAAARRHRAPARQGHLRPDGRRQDPDGGDRAVARDRRARECIASTLRSCMAWFSPTHSGSMRRSGATRHRASGWRSWPRAGRRRPTSAASLRRGDHSLVRVHVCTPAARTRSAFIWRRAAIRWLPTRPTAARRRSAWRARRCMRCDSASGTLRAVNRVRFEAAPPPDFAQALQTLRGAAQHVSHEAALGYNRAFLPGASRCGLR